VNRPKDAEWGVKALNCHESGFLNTSKLIGDSVSYGVIVCEVNGNISPQLHGMEAKLLQISTLGCFISVLEGFSDPHASCCDTPDVPDSRWISGFPIAALHTSLITLVTLFNPAIIACRNRPS
jgi:hypothetical protein